MKNWGVEYLIYTVGEEKIAILDTNLSRELITTCPRCGQIADEIEKTNESLKLRCRDCGLEYTVSLQGDKHVEME